MKSTFCFPFVAIFAIFTFFGCSSDDNNDTEEEGKGEFIINEHKYYQQVNLLGKYFGEIGNIYYMKGSLAFSTEVRDPTSLSSGYTLTFSFPDYKSLTELKVGRISNVEIHELRDIMAIEPFYTYEIKAGTITIKSNDVTEVTICFDNVEVLKTVSTSIDDDATGKHSFKLKGALLFSQEEKSL